MNQSRSGGGRIRRRHWPGRHRGGYDYASTSRDDSRSRDGPTPVIFNSHMKKNRIDRKNLDRRATSLMQSLFILDNDSDMAGGGSGSRSQDVEHVHRRNRRRRHKQCSDRVINFSRGGGGGNRRRRGPRRVLATSPTSWYKIIVRSNLDRDSLISALSNFLHPHQLIPFNFMVHAEEVSFMVDDHVVAEELFNAYRKLNLKDGRKVNVKARPFTPAIVIDDKFTETLKMVMASRYNDANKALDLSKFHHHPAFLSENILCPLNRPTVMTAALDLISESIPDLIALNLSENIIHAIDHMRIMIEKLPNLKILHMANNKIFNVKQLDSLNGLGLEELNVEGNPFCAKHATKDDYIRAIRQRFPKVIKLDGETLPPPILFDLGDDVGQLPKSQPTFMCDEDGVEFAKSFLQQYYAIFDSDDRSPLIQAYHDNAQYSMHCFIPPGQPSYLMNSYIQESRNLFKVGYLDRRVKLLLRGKHTVMESLRAFPKTQHDLSSLSVDLVLYTPTLIQLNIMGGFKEIQSSVCKGFSRDFMVVPTNPGFCIVNDMLTVFPATEKMRKSMKTKEMSQTSAGPSTIDVTSPPPNLQPPVAQQSPIALSQQPNLLDDNTKQRMVTALALKTGMNIVWSGKCLDETQWNFDQALYAFEELNKSGLIPADAFLK